MRIQKISNGIYSSPVQKNTSNLKYLNKEPKYDSVSFKSISLGGKLLISLVIKNGYKALTSDISKAKFKNEIAQRMASPDTSDFGRQLVDILFALSKTSAKNEPTSMAYDIADKYSGFATLKSLRSDSMNMLFPLIPVMKNDKNSGNAAKAALVSSMIETGEYLESKNVYHAFKSLFNQSDKEAILLKAMRDKNVWSEINETYAKPKAHSRAESSYQYEDSDCDSLFNFIKTLVYDLPKDMYRMKKYVKKEEKRILPEIQAELEIEKAIVNSSLMLTLNPTQHQDFFSNYKDCIQGQFAKAYNKISEILVSSYNNLFQKYAEGFYNESIPKQVLCKAYVSDFVNYSNNNVNNLGHKLNIDPKYALELCKDFKLINLSQNAEVMDKKLIKLYSDRIKEKAENPDYNIRLSAAGLAYFSGHAKTLQPILSKYKSLQYPADKLDAILLQDNAVYGCKKTHIPTLKEIEASKEAALEEFRNRPMTEADLDNLETSTRLAYL